MKKEYHFADHVEPSRLEVKDLEVKDGKVLLESDDLPLEISIEGRREYLLKLTREGGLILNRKD